MLRKVTAIAAALGVLGLLAATPALASEGHEATPPREIHFSFEGPFGKFNQEQLQRGYKVYREVCSSCHSMKLLSFRNLGDKGGPFWNPKYPNPNDNPVVKAIAKDYQVDDVDTETGDVVKRPGIPADRFPSPFANDFAAAASNGGALPPDMSLLAKAREGGPYYIFSVVGSDGYKGPVPHDIHIGPGQHYNKYMAGHVIAMAPPLAPNKVSFDDGTPSTVDQQAQDVAAFLYWAAEPKQDERKQMGLAVMIYLLLFAGLVYAAYRQVWRNESH